MNQTYEAIYENGVFRPLRELPGTIVEGQHVRLVVETDEPADILQSDILQLATQVYSGLTDEQVREVEQIALERQDFFNRTGS